MNNHLNGALLVFLGAAGFATEAIFIKLAYAQGLAPLTVALVRLLIATAVLGPLFVWNTFKRRIGGEAQLTIFLIGAGLNSGVMFLLLLALQRISASVAILCLYLYPTITTFLARPMLGERITPRKLVALGGALGGVALVTWGPAGGAPSITGVLYAFGAAVLNAAAMVSVKRWLGAVPPLVSTAGILSWGAMAYAVANVVGAAAGWPLAVSEAAISMAAWGYLAGLGLVSTLLAFGLLYSGLALLEASQAAIISSSEPAITAFLAAVFLGERLALAQVAGGLLIIVSAVFSATAQKARQAMPHGD